MPAIGATTNGDERATFPIFMECEIRWVSDEHSICADVSRVDFDADRLADEIDREDQPGVRTFANQTADDTLERPVRNLHHLALVNQRAGIVGEVAFDK